MLENVQFKPGVIKEGTRYSNEGGWYDSDKVRFRSGFPEKIGGWEKRGSNTFQGTCRSLNQWAAIDGSQYIGVGTNLKFYVSEGEAYNDITPTRKTSSLTNPFTTVNGSTLVTVTDAGHNAGQNDFVTFSGSGAVGGVPAADFNKEHQIVTIIDNDNYTINVATSASSAVNGGGSVTAVYQINTGSVDYTAGVGFGAGFFGGTQTGVQSTTTTGTNNAGSATINVVSTAGFTVTGTILINEELITYGALTATSFTSCTRGQSGTQDATHTAGSIVQQADTFIGWGNAATSLTDGQQLRLWGKDNFGEDLVFNVNNGGVYYWDKSGGVSAAGVALSAKPGADGFAPTVATQALVSELGKHVVCLGANEHGSNTQDPMLIRWSDTENPNVWQVLNENSAGDYRLSSGSKIIGGIKTRQEILIWTDTSLYSMNYTGSAFVFSFSLMDEGTSILSPNAAVNANNTIFFADSENFYVYAGSVQTLPCSVRNYVFDDINLSQRYKVFAARNENFNEVSWFYPSADSTEVNRYVTYNYLDQTWTVGTMDRTAWDDVGTSVTNPIAAGTNNYIYNQETGDDDDGSAMTAYIESSDIDIGSGNQMMFIRRILPDIFFYGTAASQDMNIIVKVRDYSSSLNPPTTDQTFTFQTGAANSGTTGSEQLYSRIRSRQAAFRFETNTVGQQWRIGGVRLDIKPDGRR